MSIDARDSLLALLPSGRAWMRHPSSITYRLLAVFGLEIARIQGRLEVLRGELLPSRTVELLPDWEEALGLPDPAFPPPTSIASRQAIVAGRLSDRGGHTEDDVRAIAAAMGYSPTIIERHRPFRCGASRCGDRLYGPSWSHVVTIHLPQRSIDEAVRASIERVRRAHATFYYVFTPVPDLGGLGSELPMELS